MTIRVEKDGPVTTVIDRPEARWWSAAEQEIRLAGA